MGQISIKIFSHFYSDLETRGIYIPLTYNKNKNIVAKSGDSKLNFLLDDNIIGTAGYWYYKWEPTHPKDLTSLCGTYTLLYKSQFNNWIHEKVKDYVDTFVCGVSILTRDSSYGNYRYSRKYFTLDSTKLIN